jgi:RHS repeat-associated protein
VDTAAVRVSATDPRGNVTTMAVDRFGAPTRVEQPLGRTTVYARDSLGHVTRSITPSGDMVDYVYTGANLSRTINHRSGKTTELTYNTFNQPLTSSDGDELLENTYETVNGDSRLLTTSVGTEAHAYEYVDDGRLSRALGPGSSVIYRYETTGLQNRSDELGPGGVARYTTYDAAGRPAKLRVSLYPYYTRGDSVRYDYDVLNRTRHQYDPAGNVTTFDYDSVTTRVTDAKGQAYTATTNALGWVVSRRDPGNRVESFGYDRAGNLTSYTNRRGQTVTYGYDELNRLRWRDADGQRTTYDADLAGTVSASANAESVDSVRVTPYDPAAHTAAMTHVSRRAGARYQLQTSSAMDGMLLSVRLNTPGTGYAATYWMGDYGYYNDTARRFRGVCAFASDTDCAITNAFNAPWTHVAYASETGLARAQLIGFAQDTVVSTGDSITYRRATLAETLGVRFTRDGINRVARRTNLAGDSVRAFRYDRMGQLVAWGDTVARITQDCYYDQSLLQEFCRDLPYSEGVKGESFTYDAVGNRTSAGAVLEAGNRLRAYGGFSFDYDADGNLTHKYRTGFDQQLSWNSLGQLVQAVTNGQTATYGYDGGGRRVRKTVNGVVTRYLYNGAHRVADLDGSGNVLAEYTYYPGTDRPHAMRVNGSLYYFLADGPGNVVGLVDAYGSLVNEYRYGPFGEAETVRETVAQPFRFTGRELDAETGLYYFRARYYDPLVGRFVSEDPLGLKAGLNVYAYLGNDPVNGRDPSGMQQSCRIEITRVEGHFDFSANGNPWMRMFGHWECTDSAEPRAGGDFGGAHDCTVTSSCMNQAEELNRITQIQQDQEYANQEPARQRASTAVQSAPYYSPGLADVVGNNLAAWSKVAYPGLTKIAVGGLAAPVAIMAAGGIGTGGAVLEIGAGVNAIPEEAAAIMSEARAIVTSPEMGLLRAAAESGEGLEVTIGQRTVTWTPGWSADYAGHTLGSQNGFGLVGRAMSSSNELVQTVLHELFRLETSTVLSEGATQASVAAETADAWAWAPAALAAGRWLGYW